MRGEGHLKGRSQHRTWSRKQAPQSGKMKGNLNNVVLIDVDSDGYDNVIIIDSPESLQKKLRSSSVSTKGRKFKFGGIISIDDDDDDDDENNNVDHPDTGVEGGRDLDSDTSSSKSFPASDNVHKTVVVDDDDCQVVQQKSSGFRLSKCEQAYSGKAPCRNRYGLYDGLYDDTESSSSESDCSDCELMDGSLGKFREEWEKASLKRKSNVCKGKSGLPDLASPSGLNNDTHPDVDVGLGNKSEQQSEAAFCFNSSSSKYDEQNFFDYVPTYGGAYGNASVDPIRTSHVDLDQKVDQETFSHSEPDIVERMHSSQKKADFQFRGETSTEDSPLSSWEWKSYEHVNNVGSGIFADEAQSSQRPFVWSNHHEQCDKEYHHTRTSFMDKEKNVMGEQSNFQGVSKHFDHWKYSFEDGEPSLCKSQESVQTQADNDRVVPCDKEGEFSQSTFSCSTSFGKSHHKTTGFSEKGKPISREPVVLSTSQPSDETGIKCREPLSEHEAGTVFEDSFACKTPFSGMPEIHNEKASQQDTEKLDSVGVSSSNTQCAETQSNQGRPCLAEELEQVIGSVSHNQPDNGSDPLHTGVSVIPTVQIDIINEREKLKETDEYKRAMEEEWASRQRQLQLQAEEAQRLRKRKKAESMRALDMERRQKQRVEEIRETQKKDEENMNLKEQLRAEVRKELDNLEKKATDMASLLRGLGIHVGGSFYPLSHEVHAAYKRALLRFHPDRASKTDIRQQVEAEERFKLISRMKEKFLLTSCH